MTNYKQLIKDRGLKQSWLAAKIGVTSAMLSMFLNNKANLSPEKESILRKLLRE